MCALAIEPTLLDMRPIKQTLTDQQVLLFQDRVPTSSNERNFSLGTGHQMHALFFCSHVANDRKIWIAFYGVVVFL